MTSGFWIIFASCLTLTAQETWTEAFRAGDFSQALNICDTQLAKDSRNATLWTGRALSLERLHRNAEALKSFDRALQLRPGFIPALEGAVELTYQAHDARAQEYLNQLLRIDAGNSTAHAMSGVLAFEKNDCIHAVSHFEKAGKQLTNNSEARSYFGVCLLRLNRPQEAIPIFRDLLEKLPASSTIRYDLGLAQFLSNRAGDSIDTLRPLTTGEHPDGEALNLVAWAENADGRLAAALADLRRAVQVNPQAEENYLDFATLCLEHGSTDLAKEIVDTGIAKTPTSSRLYSMRGIIEAQLSQYDEATSDFEQANRLSPEKAYGSVGLSVLYAQSKRPGEAADLLRQKLKPTPDDPTLNYLLADVLLNQAKAAQSVELTDAKAALLRSIRARPDFAGAHALLGKLYRRVGERSKAIEQFKIALTHDPGNRIALNQIVVVLRQSGRNEEASRYAGDLRRLLEAEVSRQSNNTRLRIVQTP